MNTTEYIIVGNPFQFALYDSLFNHGGIIVFLAIVLLGVLWACAYVSADWAQRRVFKVSYFYGSRKDHTINLSVAWVVTIAAALLMWYYG